VTPAPILPASPEADVAPAAGSQKSGDADAGAPGQEGAPQDPLDKALAKINKQMEAWSTQATYSIDKDTHRVVVSIKDSNTGDVIRTIPSETALRIAKMITKFQGLTIKTSA
jgi:flagellar protein FlaG